MSVVEAQSEKPRNWSEKIRWAYDHWVSRSLMVGAAATALDVVILLICVKGFGLPNPVGAMIGVVFGSAFTFFANRHFAFRDHRPQLAPQALKFMAATFVSMLLHAYLVHLLADRLGVPVVLAKLAADIGVFSVGQLLVLRYLVFPRWRPADEAAVEPALATIASEPAVAVAAETEALRQSA